MFGLIDYVREGTWRRERKGYMKSHLKAREDKGQGQTRCFGIVELTLPVYCIYEEKLVSEV